VVRLETAQQQLAAELAKLKLTNAVMTSSQSSSHAALHAKAIAGQQAEHTACSIIVS
jgi:hypothetical protein